MADVRAYYEGPEFRDLGHTPTYVSTSSFTIPTDVTAYYKTNQRIKISDTSTLYGTISSATYSAPNTTIAVTLDSGSISASISAVAVGVDPTNSPVPVAAVKGLTTYSHPAGSVQAFAGSSAPSGWLFCFGQAVSRTTYADLFTAIGTTYGSGDGSTTFTLPDMRGRAVFGKDDMGGSAANRVTNGVSGITGTSLGASGGDQNMHGHTHTTTVNDSGHSHGNVAYVNFGLPAGAATIPGTGGGGTFTSNSATTGISVSVNSNGSGSSQNMPPAIIMNWIIKT